MINIKGKNINELVYNCLEKVIMTGNWTNSRNGDVSSLYNVFSEIENPRSRHLNLQGRNNNIFATIAETFWVFAGDDKIDPYLSFFLPRAKDFSDDGMSWYGGYGPRLYNHNQMDDIIQQFRNEGIFTRRASFYIGTPELDTKESFQKTLGCDYNNIKDKPCNMTGDFFITPDKKLHMNMKSRSGDILWGFGSINIFEYTYFQEFILQELKREIDPELTLGTYNHHVTNLHLYDFSGSQGYSVLENKLQQKLGYQNYESLKFPKGVENFNNFHKELVELFSKCIQSKKSTTFKDLMNYVSSIFDKYDLSQGNLLFKYAELTLAYIIKKKHPEAVFEVNIQDLDEEVKNSIINSKFRKFEIS